MIRAIRVILIIVVGVIRRLVRLPHRTVVFVWVRGLDTTTTYPTHVHNRPCSATPAGGSHYRHEAGTGPESPEEVEAERALAVTTGWGARVLALQDRSGRLAAPRFVIDVGAGPSSRSDRSRTRRLRVRRLGVAPGAPHAMSAGASEAPVTKLYASTTMRIAISSSGKVSGV